MNGIEPGPTCHNVRMDWPTPSGAETFAPIEGRENHKLDVYLENGEVADAKLDGESFWPAWFKIEFKGNGELSAKVRGVRLTTRQGDVIAIHQGRPDKAQRA